MITEHLTKITLRYIAWYDLMVTFPHAAFKTGPTEERAGKGTDADDDCGIALFGRKTSVRPSLGWSERSAGDFTTEIP